MTSETETLALYLLHALYDATDGKPLDSDRDFRPRHRAAHRCFTRLRERPETMQAIICGGPPKAWRDWPLLET
jgi:hypothetical protein